MASLRSSARIALAASVFAVASPVLAAPHVYADAILGLESVGSCIQQAKDVANKNGFTLDHEVVDQEDFYASHSDLPLSLTVSCSKKLGTIVVAVAGMSNDATFQSFNKVYESF